jgi:hypothetical protein
MTVTIRPTPYAELITTSDPFPEGLPSTTAMLGETLPEES